MKRRVGCDFGIRPRYGILADLAFTEYLRSHRALGYDELSSFGLLIRLPVLYYLFEDENSARQCFTTFKRWVDYSNDGDAVSLTFVEYDDGAYGLITASDLTRLIDRALPPPLQEEFEPLAFIPSRILEVPMQSEGYKRFKAKVATSPFVVAAVAPKSGIQMDLAFRKREVTFVRAAEVTENHPAYIYAHRRSSAQEKFKRRSLPLPPPAEVFMRRRRQLRRFFPVTLERLRFSAKFIEVQKGLERQGL